MTKQERAERTRRALVGAAAQEINRSGYAGTSLVRVCQGAHVSMGALTFHFPTKGDLAEEISALGGEAARAVADRAARSGLPALRAVVELTLELARLLERDALTRSAARLARERAETAGAWTAAWLPTVRCLLGRADEEGLLFPDAAPDRVAALVVYLVTGVEAGLRGAGPPVAEAAPRADTGQTVACSDATAACQLRRAWELVLTGIAAPGH
jgi:AcrR family transcriptional regulator